MEQENLARTIDSTLLSPMTKASEISQLCDDANQFGFATVCVPPVWVALAADCLKDSPSSVCTVVGFPLGYVPSEIKLKEARFYIQMGAGELDFVVNQSWVKEKQWSWIESELNTLSEYCQKYQTVSKLIVETCYLSETEKCQLCDLVVSCNIDFIKTSTGFGPEGAQLDDIALFKDRLAGKAKIKASGGIKNLEHAKQFIKAGADRLGTSRGKNIVCEIPS